MVLLTATPRILDAIASLSSSEVPQVSVGAEQQLPTRAGAPISHTTLLSLHRVLKTAQHATSSSGSPPSLNMLLRGAHPYIEPPAPKPAKSPEYIALMARLRAEQEQREYRAMVAHKSKLDAGMEDDEKDDIYPSLVFNMLLSVVMCSIAVFVVTRYWPNAGVRVLVSLGAGLVVGIAEVGVYSIYLRNVRVAREKERRKKEKKFLILEHGDDEKEAMAAAAAAAATTGVSVQEEIWGRGKHGGMRRRVREKWEREHKGSENSKTEDDGEQKGSGNSKDLGRW
ncbi:hypothetical protein DV738_g2316, partial [Chaetothyriales sp. CBS 135597]